MLLIQKELSARSDRVKSVDIHPSEVSLSKHIAILSSQNCLNAHSIRGSCQLCTMAMYLFGIILQV